MFLTNTRELKALLVMHGHTQASIAEKLGITEQSFNAKLNNKKEFKATEIKLLAELLDMDAETINRIFFN